MSHKGRRDYTVDQLLDRYNACHVKKIGDGLQSVARFIPGNLVPYWKIHLNLEPRSSISNHETSSRECGLVIRPLLLHPHLICFNGRELSSVSPSSNMDHPSPSCSILKHLLLVYFFYLLSP